MRGVRVAHRPDGGFTLIELLVTLSIGAVLMGLAGTALADWSSSSRHKGARDEVVSALRVTAQRALTEGRTYCLAFATDGSWKTYRSQCSATGTLVGDGQGVDAAGETVTAAFTYPPAASGLQSACPTAGTCAYFYPRGTASGGTVTLARPGKPTYTVVVEQLTSRVYTS